LLPRLKSYLLQSIGIFSHSSWLNNETSYAQAVHYGINEIIEFGVTTDKKTGLGRKIGFQGKEFAQSLGGLAPVAQAAQGGGPEERVPKELGHS
jgi:hypothetical protein